MIQILVILAAVFGLALVFSWLANNPGQVVVEWGVIGQQVEIGLVTAIALLIALIVAVMVVWWIVKGITRAPSTVRSYSQGRARDKGYAALSQGMLALGAGDVEQAHACARLADRKLGHTREPMVLLLEAQTAIAEGRDGDARQLFDEMLEDAETRPLALRGLFLEAQREGEHEAARHYAERAAAISPKHVWATDACLEYATLEGDYDRALSLIDDQARARTVQKGAADRKRAVILAARALTELDGAPEAARDHARKAHKLDPSLVPAATAEARAHIRLNETRRATKAIEETWSREPHPDLADVYMHVRPGDSTADRLKRAQALEKAKPGHVESLLAVAHAALDAHDYDLAREKCEKAIREDPREGAFLLMADIEEARTGNASRVRHWLQSALRAPRDPAWVADGVVAREWAPVSPLTGRFDAFEWKRPARELGGPAIDVDEALTMLPGSEDRDHDYDPEGGRHDGLRGPKDDDGVEDAVVVGADEAGEIARDTDRGRMVAVNGSGSGTARGRGEPVSVTTGSGTERTGGADDGPAATDAERARRLSGMKGVDTYAMAATTPPRQTTDRASSGQGSTGQPSFGRDAATRASPGRDPASSSADAGTDGLARSVGGSAKREVRGIDLRERTVTRRPDREPENPAKRDTVSAGSAGARPAPASSPREAARPSGQPSGGPGEGSGDGGGDKRFRVS